MQIPPRIGDRTDGLDGLISGAKEKVLSRHSRDLIVQMVRGVTSARKTPTLMRRGIGVIACLIKAGDGGRVHGG